MKYFTNNIKSEMCRLENTKTKLSLYHKMMEIEITSHKQSEFESS